MKRRPNILNKLGANNRAQIATWSAVTYFQADEAQQRVPNGDFAQGNANWAVSSAAESMVSFRSSERGGQLLHMKYGGPVLHAWVNSLGFPVTAGMTYKVTFAARVSPASRASGQFVLIWGKSEQPIKEWSRQTIPFAPAW